VDSIEFSQDVDLWQYLVNRYSRVSELFSLVNCVCVSKNTVFSTLFKYGRQKPNTASRNIVTAENIAAPAVTRNGSSDEKSGLPYNVAYMKLTVVRVKVRVIH
jgi:hypothetical protein